MGINANKQSDLSGTNDDSVSCTEQDKEGSYPHMKNKENYAGSIPLNAIWKTLLRGVIIEFNYFDVLFHYPCRWC